MIAPTSSGARLGLASRFSHLVTGEEEVVLVADDECVTLTGRAVTDLARLLDGTRSAFEIAEELHLAHRADLVYRALGRLEGQGLVASRADGAPEPFTAELPGSSTRAAQFAVIVGEAWARRVDGDPVSITLKDGVGGTVTLLLTDDYLRPSVAAEAVRAFSVGERMLLGLLGWEQAWLGPYVDPTRTACVTCLIERLRRNLPGRALVNDTASATGDPTPHVEVLRSGAHPSAPRLLGSLLADAEIRAGGLSSLGDLLMVRCRDGTSRSHRVQRLPDCPECGSPALTVRGADIRLVARQKVSGSSGGYRMITPLETLRLHEHLVDPLTGPVRFLERVEGPDDQTVHVYTANHAGGAPRATLRSARTFHRDRSGGKGATDLDARASALCESLERCSALFRGREPERLASLEELGGAAVAPNEILHFSDGQYETRMDWNRAQRNHFQYVPERYPESVPISWTAVRSLGTGELRYVPTAAVYMGFHGAGSEYLRADSNGLAGGNCLEEAILQAFCELVERDAVAIWWYNRLDVPGVELDGGTDPYVDAVRRFYERSGRDLWVLDLTTDLAVPCFAAVSSSRVGPRENIIFGFGAHLDAAVALRRAVTELNQMLPTVLRSPEERAAQLLPEFRDVIAWWDTATLCAHPYLRPKAHTPARRTADFPRYQTDDLLADVEHCLARADSRGMDVLVCDLTRPDIGLSVARVFVPPLRHFWRRLGPGRLYDVPVEMGRLERPIAESEMNPVPMFV